MEAKKSARLNPVLTNFMKLIGRIFIILAAALIVACATYGLVQSTGGGRFALRDGGRAGGQFLGGNGQLGSNRPRGDFGGQGGRRGGGLFGAFDILRNIFVVGVIFLVIMSASVILDSLRKTPPGDPLAESD
jgi:hypothetical protein